MSGPTARAQDSEGEDLAAVQGRLAAFAAGYAHLPLYGSIAGAASTDDEVADLLTAAAPGQARPVLLLAALHDLVLRRPDVAAAPWFARAASSEGLSPAERSDAWVDVRATLLDHAEELRAVVASRSTQTNEVNRAAYVAVLLARAAADVPDRPVALVEPGCSAGLLLAVDRYSVELGGVPGRVPGVEVADPRSSVRCAAPLVDGSAPAAGLRLPPVVDRVGLDRSPVALDDVDEVRWLEACLWPDQPQRLERFRAAVALLRPDPPRLVAGDMVDDLPAVLASLVPDVHVVVLTSWALTYVRRDRRPLVAEALAALAADGRPVTWASAEPPGAVPGVPLDPDAPEGGETTLALRRWRSGAEEAPRVVGAAHPHAAWLSLT